MRFLQRFVLVLGMALSCATVAAGAEAESSAQKAPVCPAPVSTCGDGVGSERDCPPGFRCSCVPSCPTCRDCATQVCVADPSPECRTACDCDPGLGCFDGQCIAGFAPVFCCDGEQCPSGEQCQHADGRMDRCPSMCVDQLWRCETPGNPDAACGEERICSCSASCPGCEDCGPGVCTMRGAPTPYRCGENGSCQQPGDRCLCVASCPDCDDCALNVCVPACKSRDCEKRLEKVRYRTNSFVGHAAGCRNDGDCVRIETSTGCRGTCGAWVNRQFGPRVERFVARLDQRYCSAYGELGCATTSPRCQREVGACIAGQCTGLVPPDVEE